MTIAEKQAAITELERKLLDTLDAYVLAIRMKQAQSIKEGIYDEVNKIKQKMREIKAAD